jgi:deazaflavin-dependent oxidoreductase (nitroreductase family)
MLFWRLLNPVARALAGWAPWWVVLETTGRRSRKPRRVPLAKGPRDGSTVWVISVHGRHASFTRNIVADPNVRLRLGGRWHLGRAAVVSVDPAVLRRFSLYARMGPRTVGIDPVLVRIDLDQRSSE